MNVYNAMQFRTVSSEGAGDTTPRNDSGGFAYQSAATTPELVGNQEILASIRMLIEFSQTAVVYITGVGGVGKTRLLQHLLKYPVASGSPKRDSIVVTIELIDLYHTRNRSIGGLIESLLVLTPQLDAFIREAQTQQADGEPISEQLTVLARAEQEGVSRGELLNRRRDLTHWFIGKINEFTQSHRFVIALDTAERLFVARDIAQEQLNLAEQRPPVLGWLLHELLPTIRNTTILLAGRPEPLNLNDELQQIADEHGLNYLSISLPGLHIDDALAYFQAVTRQMQQVSQVPYAQSAAMLEGITEEERQALFYCLHDPAVPHYGTDEDHFHVRPILLALAIDHLAVAGRPLSSLKQRVQEAKALSNGNYSGPHP